jgi:hypothetical protein
MAVKLLGIDFVEKLRSTLLDRRVNEDYFSFSSICHEYENTKICDDKKKIRKIQWKIYQAAYQNWRILVDRAVQMRKQGDRYISCINLTDIGKLLRITEIDKKVLVPENTKIVEISCVDEATQSGEFINESDLKGNLLGTVSDPNANRYILDIAGSGALKYVCSKTECQNTTPEKIGIIEDQRLADLASRLVFWCCERSIIKLTVTYHEGCGAVAVRKEKYPGLKNKSEIQVASDCANLLAQKISEYAEKKSYKLQITTAFICNKQMCKFRPMQMHNALGTIACLDSRVLGKNIDIISHLNFFSVLVYSEFEQGKLLENDYTIDTIESAAKNIALTCSIAFGNHSWGKDHFSISRPYLVHFMTRSSGQEIQVASIIESLKKRLNGSDFEKLEFSIIRTDL